MNFSKKLTFIFACLLGVQAMSNSAIAAPTVEEFMKILEEERIAKEKGIVPQESIQTELLEGRVITFNTKNQKDCEDARISLKLGAEVCEYNAQKPLVSVIVMDPVQNREEFEKKIDFKNMSEKEKIGYRSLFDFSVMGAGMMGLLYSLPESVTNWDKSKGFTQLASQYGERVKNGPVVDKDAWAINYIGHPVSGAYYYTMVRHQGFSALESATFSVVMSTFFWEYGLEAFMETPSIQDLILTPLVGSILGEAFYVWSNSIEANNGKLLGSKRLGNTARVLMNPAGAIGNQINKIFDYRLIKNAELSIKSRTNSLNNIGSLAPSNSSTNGTYLMLEFKF